jgi:phosphoribosylformylglycinamidine (FGAM) synthase-like amidotransferase family enzyme
MQIYIFVDAVVSPGGFSYGCDLRCGAVKKFAPIMEKLFIQLLIDCQAINKILISM